MLEHQLLVEQDFPEYEALVRPASLFAYRSSDGAFRCEGLPADPDGGTTSMNKR